ncbi:type III pantothenate kinase [Porcipelethomonas sp.]|uniref:type III pantothenate kinase n=1 Tax=Porcipelethomonas sp. TaxID=2981675 RepID=UPI003EF796BE
MILAIDIGNTNIVIGCGENEKMIFVERLSTNHNQTSLEFAILVKNILELNGISPDDINGAIMASVVPAVTGSITHAIEKIIHKKVMVVGPGIKTGVSIIIDNPAQLGADLVVGAVAGIHYYSTPLIIFDLGTATTVSVIDKDKNYIGGMIMPGVNTAQGALTKNTSLLQKVAIEAPKKIIGKNTIDCMKSGAVYGTAACLDGVIDRIESEMGYKMNAVATGGLAGCIIPYCRHKITVDDELLLNGLMQIYMKNI